MWEVAQIVGYLVMVVVGGALLAPLLWWLGQWAIAIDLLPQLRPFPFDKYFNRAALIVAVVGLPLLLRRLQWGSWSALGLTPNAHRWRHLTAGLCTACCGLMGSVACLVAMGRLELQWGGTPTAWVQAAVTALAVGVVEEMLFRGVLLGVLRRSLQPFVAVVFLSLFFAALHFMRPNPAMPRLSVVHLTSGFALLPHLLWEYTEPQRLLGSLVTLTVMAGILGYTVLRSQSLYWAIGLHTGWVLCIKGLNLTVVRPRGPDLWLGEDLRSGLAPLAVMLSTSVVVWVALRRGPAAGVDAEAAHQPVCCASESKRAAL